MNKSPQSNFGRDRINHFVRSLSAYRMLLIVPTVVCTVLALGYALFKYDSWTARQSLVIRDDLVGKSFKPGRFESLDSLKSAQETILEIARKPQVISNALKNLGPPPMMLTGRQHWPSEKVIEDVQGTILIGAPNGAEFGKTEVILLSAKASSRERARQFIELLLTEIDQKLREVRSAKIQSMSEELGQAVETARISFETSAKQLQQMDAKFGADLSTLRSLNLPNASDGSIQKTISEIRSEQRRQATEVDLAKKQQEMLIKSYQDPAQYLVTSSELLKMQPRLEQLVAGLSASQLELAKVSGKYTEEHTEVKSAKRAILDIKVQILKEIQASIHALGANIEFGEDRIRKLVESENKLEDRLSELSSARVEYDKLEQEVSKKSEVLGQARQELVQVQSVGQSNIDLLTRVGEPQVSTRPDGPGKRMIVVAGVLGGLLIGFGLFMFTVPLYEVDDQPETRLPGEHPQTNSQQSPTPEPAVQPPVPVATTPTQPQRQNVTTADDKGQQEPLLPALIQPPATQPTSTQSGSDQSYANRPAPSEIEPMRPEVVLQPRNILEQLNAQSQSALTAKKQSQPVKQEVSSEFNDRRVIPTRRKTDSTFAAKSQPESIRRPASGQATPNAEPPTATHLTAEMEIVDGQSSVVKICQDPAPTLERPIRPQEKTPQLERGQIPGGLGLSQMSQSHRHRSAADGPITAAPLDEQKLKHKSNVRPINLTKSSQGLNQIGPNEPLATDLTQPEHQPGTTQIKRRRNPESTIDLSDQVSFSSPTEPADFDDQQVEKRENTSPFETRSELSSGSEQEQKPEVGPIVGKRQSAVTEQLSFKQIYSSLDQPELRQFGVELSPETLKPDLMGSDSADDNRSEVRPADAADSESAAGRDEILKGRREVADALSPAEIVQQLRVQQQQAAADESADMIKRVALRPANHGANSNKGQPDVIVSSNEQNDGSTVLEIRRRGDSPNDSSRPISGASPINEQIQNLNEAIAEFCDPKKRKSNVDEDNESEKP